MTTYAFRCRGCGTRRESTSREVIPCVCGDVSKRDYSSVQIGTPTFTPHFNHAVGRFVSSSRDFDTALKVAGDAAGTTFTRVDPGDVPTPTSGTEIFETRDKLMRDKNIRPESLV